MDDMEIEDIQPSLESKIDDNGKNAEFIEIKNNNENKVINESNNNINNNSQNNDNIINNNNKAKIKFETKKKSNQER